MDLSNFDHTIKPPLLIDKDEVIKVLNDLMAQYPTDEIPFEVIEKALARFTQTPDLGRLQDNPSINKLDQILAQHKNLHTS
jgi:hypothetical protein